MNPIQQETVPVNNLHFELCQSKVVKVVRKRNGELTAFLGKKIYMAILKAGKASGEFAEEDAYFLTLQVVRVIDHRFKKEVLDIEEIQDIVEQCLITSNYLKTARAYIVYREKHKTLRSDKRTVVDVISSINEYLEKLDWRVNAKAILLAA